MFGRLTALLNLKRVRKDQALVMLQRKKREVEEAEVKLLEAAAAVKKSALEIPAKEDAAYDVVMRKTVGMEAIDAVKGKILEIAQEHAVLVNAEERAAHVLARARKELEEATQTYRLREREEAKYIELTDSVKKQIKAEAEYKEEIEIEDTLVMRH